MSGYAIMAVEARSGDEVEICRTGGNPEAIAEAVRRKTYRVKHTNRWWRRPLYRRVWIEELADAAA